MPSTPPAETVESLRTALAEMRARAVGAEMMVEHLQLEIAKLRREHFGQRSERGRNLLDQLELQLEELEATATEDECAAAAAKAKQAESVVKGFTRKRPARGPLPAHLPRERNVLPSPCACPDGGGKGSRASEGATQALAHNENKPQMLRRII